MAKIKGIDVSHWQGDIDFAKVKANGIDFVIIRAGYGKLTSQKDKCFEQNYSRAKAAGLHVGVYWYSYASSAADAKKEAQACISVIKGKQFDYPVYFDIEEKSQLSKGKDFCSSLIKAFCDEMESDGYYAGFYTSASYAASVVSDDVRKRYAAWIAQWASKCTYSGQYGLWQYSSDGSVNGISGRVDMDMSYVDYPSVITSGGYNGYAKTNTSSAKKSVDELAKEVIAGSWGNGETRKQRLTAAGYDYSAVQAKVNEILFGKSASTTAAYETYTVIKGDTLWGIAAKKLGSGTRYKEIKALNGLSSDTIYAGQKLKMPKK